MQTERSYTTDVQKCDSNLSRPLLIGYSSNLQATWTGIKSRMSSNFSQIRFLTRVMCPWELCALELKHPHMFTFWTRLSLGPEDQSESNLICIILGMGDWLRICQPDQTTHFKVVCPLAKNNITIWLHIEIKNISRTRRLTWLKYDIYHCWD